MNTELETLPNASYLKRNVNIAYNPDGESKIELFSFGEYQIAETTLGMLNSRLKDYSGLKKTLVTVNQSKNSSLDELKYLQAVRERDSLDLLSRTEQISFLQNKVRELTALERMKIPFQEVVQEARINYENLTEMGFAYQIKTDFNKIDTIPLFEVKWNQNIRANQLEAEEKKLARWLRMRLQDSTIIVKSIN